MSGRAVCGTPYDGKKVSTIYPVYTVKDLPGSTTNSTHHSPLTTHHSPLTIHDLWTLRHTNRISSTCSVGIIPGHTVSFF